MQYSVEKELSSAEVSLREEVTSGGITLLHIDVSYPEPTVPRPIYIRFDVPFVNMYAAFYSHVWLLRHIAPEWRHCKVRSRLALGMPLLSLFSVKGENAFTVSLEDAMTSTEAEYGLREEDGRIYFKIGLHLAPMPKMTEYHTVMRIDTRPIPYEDAIRSAVSYWETVGGYVPAPVPSAAKLPMYSSWYSYHQDTRTDALLAECRMAKQLGMDTIIIDDGWQTDDMQRGYAYCGDWELAVGKIPDMRALVDGIHEIGMKVMVWFSVPYVGKYSKIFERFRGMYLEDGEHDVYRLDPRYKEVRDYLVEVYSRSVLAWGIDGLKLDFIDSFSLDDPYAQREDASRDIPSLEDGVDRLMTDTMNTLRQICPDIMIEFRQQYVGPAIRKYGNMLRAADCPNDAFLNRLSVVDLRLTSGQTAVHSDMIMWNAEESVEQAALAIVSILFSVPQISVRLAEQSEAHKKMLRHLLSFHRAHTETLVSSPIYAPNPASNYTSVFAEGEDEFIAVDYSATPIRLSENAKKQYVFRAGCANELVLLLSEKHYGLPYTVVDCMGEPVSSGVLRESAADVIFVPLCGMIEIG